jgi:hypothetical protein
MPWKEGDMMTAAKDLFRPNGLKILLALTLLLPILFLVMIFAGLLLYNPVILIILACVISYVVSSLVDHFIKSRTVKIIIASLAALISIVLGYVFVRSMMQVCDPVHTPQVFDPVHTPTQQPTVITPATTPSETPMIFDPVHVPNACEQACRDAVQNATNMTSLVAQKLNECLQNCYK